MHAYIILCALFYWNGWNVPVIAKRRFAFVDIPNDES
jgi:hypothetical protein